MTIRRGASLIIVMVFLLMSFMLTTHIFFFSSISMNANADNDNLTQSKITLDALINNAKKYLRGSLPNMPIVSADYMTFHEKTLLKKKSSENSYVQINYLRYDLEKRVTRAATRETNFYVNEWDNIPLCERVFPPMSDDKGRYFLIRAYTKQNDNTLMHQVVVRKSADVITTLSYNEIWY